MNQEELARLENYKQRGTLSQGEALEYHELLNKEEAVEPLVVEEAVVEAPKKRGKKGR